MSYELSENTFAQHVAVISLSAEVYDKRPSGELSGVPRHKIDRIVLKIEGHDRDNCIIRLNELIAELKKKCLT